jgi:formylglycine-generating enzyme required for sulfatase activity
LILIITRCYAGNYNYDRPDVDILTVLEDFVLKAEEEIKNHDMEISDEKGSFFLFKSLKKVITNNRIPQNEPKLIEAAFKCFDEKKPVQLKAGGIEKSVSFLVELCSRYKELNYKELNYIIYHIDNPKSEPTGAIRVYINQNTEDDIKAAKQFEKWIKREKQRDADLLRKAQEEAESREKEKAEQEEESLIRKQEKQERFGGGKEEKEAQLQRDEDEVEKHSHKKFYAVAAVILVFGAILLSYWINAPAKFQIKDSNPKLIKSELLYSGPAQYNFVGVSPNGGIYLAPMEYKLFRVENGNTTRVEDISHQNVGEGAWGFSFSQEGTLYFADVAGGVGKIFKVVDGKIGYDTIYYQRKQTNEYIRWFGFDLNNILYFTDGSGIYKVENASESLLYAIKQNEGFINSLAVAKDGTIYFVVINYNANSKGLIYRLEEGKEPVVYMEVNQEIDGFHEETRGVSIGPDGSFYITIWIGSGGENTVNLWRVVPENSKITPTPTPKLTPTITLTLSPTPTSTPTPPLTPTPLLKRLNVVTEVFNNNVDAATAAGLERTGRGQAFENGYYYVVERQGDKYVALNGKIDKLVKLIREDGKILRIDGTVYIEKKSLTVGETWDVGDGWTLMAQSIDAKASPRRAWLVLSKDGIKKDDKVVSEKSIYTYVEKSIARESDVPLFVTYVDAVFAGATSDMAQFTYTWVISPEIASITPVPSPTPTPTLALASTPAPDQKTITNSIGMEFVLIPAGEFDMGSPSNEFGRYVYEGPVHRVKIGKAFYMGKFEVTDKQWYDVMENDSFKGVDRPTTGSSHDFIEKLNQKEGSNKYRLPTEAEWEYAARAGTTTSYSFGDDISKLGDYAWYDANSGGIYDRDSHGVGQKKPNPWGLYDMHGNVWEAVQDDWHNDYNGAPTDGSSWGERKAWGRIYRGGSSFSSAASSRSAFRGGYLGYSGCCIGFRLVRDL